MPYGAYELKATYQRNLLLGLMTVTVFCLMTVAIGWILKASRPPVVYVPPSIVHPPVQTSLDETQFKRPAPVAPVGPRLHEIDALSRIPNPVADEELDPAESNGLIMSKDDKWGVVEDDGREPGGGEGGGSQAAGLYDPDEEFPGINDFRYVEEEAVLIYSVTPEYPRLAKLAGDEGKVVIKALISKTGAVLDAVVYVSSGHALLDEAALAVAGEYKYRPAIQNGSPVAVWIAYNVTFALQ
jgi:protein TonB